MVPHQRPRSVSRGVPLLGLDVFPVQRVSAARVLARSASFGRKPCASYASDAVRWPGWRPSSTNVLAASTFHHLARPPALRSPFPDHWHPHTLSSFPAPAVRILPHTSRPRPLPRSPTHVNADTPPPPHAAAPAETLRPAPAPPASNPDTQRQSRTRPSHLDLAPRDARHCTARYTRAYRIVQGPHGSLCRLRQVGGPVREPIRDGGSRHRLRRDGENGWSSD